MAILFVSVTGIYAVDLSRFIDDSRFISYITNPKKKASNYIGEMVSIII